MTRKSAKAAPAARTFSDELRAAIRGLEMSTNSLAKTCGIPTSTLARFLDGSRPNLGATAIDKLTPLLGLRLASDAMIEAMAEAKVEATAKATAKAEAKKK